MIETANFRNGLTIELDGEPYVIVYFQHVKPGKGGAFVRTKLKSLRTGNLFERTFRAGERMNPARVERRKVQFLYGTAGEYHLMDMDTFDEFVLSEAQMGDSAPYLTEGAEVQLALHEGEIIGVEPPQTVDLKVTETAPGVRGDTAAGSSKPATLETGLVVQVPFFVNVGDKVRVDSRSGLYVERVE